MECRTGEAMLDTHRVDRNTGRPDFEPLRLGPELAGRHADDDYAGSGNLPVSSHSRKNDSITFAGTILSTKWPIPCARG